MLLNSLLVAYTGTVENADGDIESYLYPDIWTSFAKEKLSAVFLWAAVALAAVLIAVGFFVWFHKQEKFKRYLTSALTLAVGFSVAVIVAMLSLEFMDMAESGAVFDLVLYPTVALGAVVVLGAAAVYAASLFGEKAKKISLITAGSVMAAAAVALLVCLGVYLSSGKGEANNEVTITTTENALLYVCAAVLIAALVVIALFFGRKDKKGFDSKSVAYAAVCIAMSFALSYLTLFHMPQGGSVTVASLLPLMIYSYMFGVKKGVFAGFVYGILQAVQDPWIIHPAQFLLDYPIAFACIGVAGLFANVKKLEKFPQLQFALGAVVASAMRFISHVLSGVFAFSEYAYTPAGEPMSAWLYSLGYNAFVFVDIAIVIAVGIMVFSSKAFVREVRKFNAPAKPAPVSATTAAPATAAEQEPATDIVPAQEPTDTPAVEPAPVESVTPTQEPPAQEAPDDTTPTE